MKNFLKITLVFLAVSIICTTAFAQKNIYGYINSDELMKIMPGADSAVAQ